MRLRTIWTMPTFTLRERVNRTEEWFWMKLAHRLPRKLALWSFIDTGTRYMGRDEVVPEVRYTEILQRIEV